MKRFTTKHSSEKHRQGRNRWYRRQLNSESGTTVLEFSILLPIFVLVVFAAMEVGRVYSVQQHLNAGALLAARTGSIRNSTVGDVNAALTTYFASTEVGTDFTANITGVSNTADVNTYVTVNVAHTVSLFTSLNNFGFANVTVPLTGSATLRHQ